MNQLKIYLPPPSNWQDFQLLVKEIAAIRYNPGTVVEYGRQGQTQDGVDVFAEDYHEHKIGIQCKESKDKLSDICKVSGYRVSLMTEWYRRQSQQAPCRRGHEG